MVDTVDSNSVGLAYSEEVTLKVLPANPVFHGLEPNSFTDFGGELGKTSRRPINPSRQRRKGGITDLDASGGMNHDLVHTGLQDILQGFMFADMREKGNTHSLSETAIPITAVASPANTYAIADGDLLFSAGDIVLATGFGATANNGIKTVTAATDTITTVSQALAAEAPPATAALRAIGFQFAAADATLTVAGGVATLGATVKDLTELELNIGEWVFLGGDAVGTKFENNPQGYARVSSIGEAAITFDKVTWAGAVTDPGTGKTIRIFFGDFLRNEKVPTLIKRRSYTLQRTLGNDGVGIQSEYLLGSIPNELTMNIPVPAADSKINLDLTFVGMDSTQRTGTQGPLSATGGATYVDPPLEDFFNSSTHVYRQRIAVIDPASLNPTALFGYVQEATITLTNGVTPNKAIGTLGAFNASTGLFEVDSELTAYFSTVAAIEAIKDNSDVTYDLILAKDNQAMVYDLPMVSLGGGRLDIALDAPITIPIEQAASEGPMGFTLGLTFFPYIPNIGMAY